MFLSFTRCAYFLNAAVFYFYFYFFLLFIYLMLLFIACLFRFF
ncbi:hypothetical protein HMPREF3230_01082 [Gardnerella vaginalis]|uniref:Uncharacterized protein n=1 Tax=Gardnerella vaginalis TaxID=2702 RepID=A0A135Z4C8_GARVA|nr:hypothetical protein HMPREF3230_01082 [Gardnerella vaginalis]